MIARPIPSLALLAALLLAVPAAAQRPAVPDCNADQLAPDPADRAGALAAYQAGVGHLQAGRLAEADRALRRAFAAADASAPPGLATAALGRLVETALAAGNRTTAWHRLRRLRTAVGNDPRPAWIDQLLLKADAETAAEAERPDVLRSVAGCRSFGVAPAVPLRILFRFGTAELDGDGQAQMQRLAAAVQAAGISRATLRGHTDQQGSDQVNDALSLARARTVASALAAALPALAGKLAVEGRGKREPLYTAPGAEQDRLNRRVELVLGPS